MVVVDSDASCLSLSVLLMVCLSVVADEGGGGTPPATPVRTLFTVCLSHDNVWRDPKISLRHGTSSCHTCSAAISTAGSPTSRACPRKASSNNKVLIARAE